MVSSGFGPYHGMSLDDAQTKYLGVIPTPCAMIHALGLVQFPKMYDITGPLPGCCWQTCFLCREIVNFSVFRRGTIEVRRPISMDPPDHTPHPHHNQLVTACNRSGDCWWTHFVWGNWIFGVSKGDDRGDISQQGGQFKWMRQVTHLTHTTMNK